MLAAINEEIILIKRKHKFLLYFPIFLVVVLDVFLIIISSSIFLFLHLSWLSYISLIGIAIIIGLILISKNIIEWSFHWYLMTNKKIMEICYVPLTTYYINDILLGQVKCTEIDIHADGLINELLDMGAISITFDRPTHEEGFFLRNIHSARRIGLFLTDYLLRQSLSGNEEKKMDTAKRLPWYREDPFTHKWSFGEDIFPKAT